MVLRVADRQEGRGEGQNSQEGRGRRGDADSDGKLLPNSLNCYLIGSSGVEP